MSQPFIRKSLEKKNNDNLKDDESRSEETIIDQFEHRGIDECGINDLYPSALQTNMLDSLQSFSQLFDTVNTLLYHLQSPKLMQFFSEKTSRRDYDEFIANIEKYHKMRLQIHSLNKLARKLLNKALAISKKR